MRPSYRGGRSKACSSAGDAVRCCDRVSDVRRVLDDEERALGKEDDGAPQGFEDYFAQWRDISESASAALRACQVQNVAIQQSIEASAKAIAAVTGAYGDFHRLNDYLKFEVPKIELRDFNIRIPQIDIPDLSAFEQQITVFHGAFRNLTLPAVNFRADLKSLSPRVRENLLLLASAGWFLDPEMTFPQVTEFAAALSNDADVAEELLVTYFHHRLDEIESFLVGSYPLRANLLAAAFRAHRRGEYVLSIPVLLAQADGICEEATTKSLFRRKDKRPATADYVGRFSDYTLEAAFLSPLASVTLVNELKDERESNPAAFNRHAIMHGEALEYGNKMNGLKAIALINYLAFVLRKSADHDAKDVGDGASLDAPS